MGRSVLHAQEFTNYIGGRDHALGEFLQITDERFRTSGKDLQGEGYVLDWDALCGFSVNEIKATLADIESGPERLQELVEIFITSLLRQELL